MSFSISDRMEKKEGGEDAPGPAVCLQVGAGRRPGHHSLEAGLTPTAPLGVLSSWPSITHFQSRVFWDHAAGLIWEHGGVPRFSGRVRAP